MFNLKNKNVIITGSSRGIGKSIAKKLASNGCNLFLLSRNIDDLINVKNEIYDLYKVNINCYSLDISNYDEVQTTFQKITNDYVIDILVNNAGITKDNLLIKMSSDDWNSVINTNLTGYFNCSKCIIKQMIKQKNGKIVNISSIIGIQGNSGQTNYSASKAGIIGFTKALSKEIGSRNINVNTIAPGYINTQMTDELGNKNKQKFLDNISLRRFGETEDVANLVCFLASDLSSYITGQTISIDGGIN